MSNMDCQLLHQKFVFPEKLCITKIVHFNSRFEDNKNTSDYLTNFLT